MRNRLLVTNNLTRTNVGSPFSNKILKKISRLLVEVTLPLTARYLVEPFAAKLRPFFRKNKQKWNKLMEAKELNLKKKI